MLSSTSAYSMPPSGLHNQACVVRSHSMSSSRHPHISSTLPSSSVVISSSTTVVPSVIIQPHTRHMTSHNQSSKSSGDLVIGQSSSSLRHNYHQPSSLTPTSSLTTKPSSIVISTTSNCTESCSNLISNQSHSSNLSHHSSAGGMDRELGAQRDRQIRLASVHTDLSLDLPPSIPLPDGEEIPYGSSSRLHIRDSEQVRFKHPDYISETRNR
ncbi:uncharacterized serine-rich protein C215.13-like [Diaphorina citri]|uniref:Uncharacterized serine-rich protein C215.13-like n=1 Tax=Diaphorina citri TaxID=121845 RepID=A0A3Q0IKA5_DIACI|nr:uncharacterized serine-rich protein C215.13-like [Diaphorina citri]